MPVEGPCSWPYEQCCDTSPGEPEVDMASWMLWAATGRKFGPCQTTVLPCVEMWVVCGVCWNPLRHCGCSSVSELKLPGPVIEIVEVVIDGDIVDPFSYRVDDWQWLVNLEGSWPTNSDPRDYDSFRVTYTQGIPPPPGAALVTGELACHLSKSLCDNGGCRLPHNTKQVTRQGVRIELGVGGFGIFMVDQWVGYANSPVTVGAVHSPDLPQHRQVTWQASSP